MARIEREFSKKGKDLKGKVYVSVGEKEDDIGVPLKSLVNSLKSRKYDGLELEFEEIDGESHMSSMAYAYTRGLKWVFSRSPKE